MTARSAADRQRRLRRRRAAGRAVLRVEIDEVEHVERLIAAGFLDPHQCDDRDAIERATARLLAAIEVADIIRHA